VTQDSDSQDPAGFRQLVVDLEVAVARFEFAGGVVVREDDGGRASGPYRSRPASMASSKLRSEMSISSLPAHPGPAPASIRLEGIPFAERQNRWHHEISDHVHCLMKIYDGLPVG
jgi:hypothetical protein